MNSFAERSKCKNKAGVAAINQFLGKAEKRRFLPIKLEHDLKKLRDSFYEGGRKYEAQG